jgi:hypothetical protein
MEEVDGKTQAEMAIKLSDNVRELVRQHLKDALEDPNFIANVNTYTMTEGVLRNVTASNHNFQMAVRHVIANQLNKY